MPAKKAAAKKIAAPSSAPAPQRAARKSTAKAATARKPAPKAATATKGAAKKPAAPKAPAVKATKGPKRKPALSEGAQLAISAARFADDMKAESVLVLDVSQVSSITDYFVICSGTSSPHLKAIAREVRAGLAEKHGQKPAKTDGETESQWVVLDYGIMMVHAFHPSKRELYGLEDLWSDAKAVEWRE